jgi:hypothetical protein
MIKQPYLFFSKNFLKTTQYADGTPTSDIAKMYDGDRTTLWQSSEILVDKTIFFTDDFGNIINRTFDTLIFQNTNISGATIYAADSSGNYYQILQFANNTEKYFIKNLNFPTETSSLRIVIPLPDNSDYAEIGELKVCKYFGDVCCLTSAKEQHEANAGTFRTTNGRLIHYKDFLKWAAKIDIENLPKDNFFSLKEAIFTDEELIIAPYKDHNIEAIRDCYVDPEFSYQVDRKTELYSLSLEAAEL